MPYRHLHFSPPVIAHRGARMRAPENTLAAFQAARESGALWIEADVKLTADGIPILMHDDTLDRTTDGQGNVADADWDKIQHLDAGSWFGAAFTGARVPRMADLLVFALQNHLRLNLELKPCPGRTQATAMVSLIEAAKLWPETAQPLFISSFDVEALVIAARLHPGWPRGLLLDSWRDDWRDLVAQTQATAIHLNVELITVERVDLLRQADLSVLAYTVNDAARAAQLIRQDVSAVFTDDPGALIASFSETAASKSLR